MPERHDDDEEHIDLDGVDDSVVTDSDAKSSSAPQGSRSWRSGVVRQQEDRALNTPAILRVEPAEGSHRRGPQLDAVLAHSQPRSAFTCSQGIFGPSSTIAASNAATSSASSKAAIISS